MRVLKTGITIVSRDHPVFPCTSKLLASLVYPSRDGSDDQVIRKASRREKPERKRKVEGMRIQGRLSRIVDHGLAMPPSVPMVF